MKIFESKTIAEAFLRRTQKEPNKVAFRYKKNGAWKELTFQEQFENIRRLSIGLIQQGIKKGGKVSILAQTSLAWGQFDMAIMGCGAITVPVYPTNTPEDTTYILNHSEVELIFIDDFKNLQKILSIADQCKNLKKIVVNFEFDKKEIFSKLEIIPWNALHDLGLNNEKQLSTEFENNLRETKSDDIFTICYTSGTTGLPKGVVLPHSTMHSVMVDVGKVILRQKNISENEMLLSFLPMSHIFGKWESMTPYFLGWTQSYAESIDQLLTNLQEVRPTIWVSVPRIYEKAYAKIMSTIDEGPAIKRSLFQWALSVGKEFLDAREAQKRPSPKISLEYKLAQKLVFSKISERFGGRMKLAVSGSAPLAKNIQEFMHIVGVPVFEGYGLTETCAPVCVNMPDANKFGTVGKLFPEVLVKIAEDGEILIKSEKVFREYYKNETATNEAIRDGWFYTGDIGHLDDDGYLKITDRKKDLIKTAGGKFVAPQKIENIVKSSKYLNQVVVYGDQKPFITALLTLNQEAVIQYAHTEKILFSEFSELLKKTEIQNLIAKTIEDINEKLARYETIKKYHLIPKEFTVEDGELTPSLKIKRKYLSQKYAEELEALYK